MTRMTSLPATRTVRALPGGIWALGVKGSVALHGTRLSQTSPRRRCAVPPTVCDKHSTQSARPRPAPGGHLMGWMANDIKAVLWAAVVPAAIAVVLLVVAIREPEPTHGAMNERIPLALADIRLLPRAYWWVVALGAVFTMARFSEAFLVLRAQDGRAWPARARS